MKYRIIGVDRATGEPRELTIAADSEQAALEQAATHAVMVEKVKPVTEASVMPDLGPPPQRKPPKPRGGDGSLPMAISVTILVVLLMGGAIVSLINNLDRSARFRRDNAHGAAANALENIEALLGFLAFTGCVVALLLLICVWSLVGLNGALDKLSRRE